MSEEEDEEFIPSYFTSYKNFLLILNKNIQKLDENRISDTLWTSTLKIKDSIVSGVTVFSVYDKINN